MPLYGFDPESGSNSVPEEARAKLQEMTDEVVGTSGLVAIYVPEGTAEVYEPDPMRGRVVDVVQLLEMPRRGIIEDYSCADRDGSLRWPIGWPSEAVYAPDDGQWPSLREHVEHLWPGCFGSFVKRFLHRRPVKPP
jgi:hypothetical protein